jgi:Mg2+ and Co2+ transporter CorA
MLRMLRVGRAVAFGTRAGSAALRQPRHAGPTVHATTPTVTVVREEDDLHPVSSDWDSFLKWKSEPDGQWFHALNLGRHRFDELADTAGLPPEAIKHVFEEDGHAKLREGGRYATLVLQIPTVSEEGFPTVHRDRLFAVVTKDGVLTATTGSFDLQTSVEHLAKRAALPRVRVPVFPFPVQITSALLSVARDRNRFVAQRFEEWARRLEPSGAQEGGSVFLRETDRLRREISTAALDLWHVKGTIRALADGKTKLRGVDLKDEKYFDDLLAEMESLHETVNKTKEEITTLIELHINLKSFQMNGFLKLLAVVSFLGLIPTVAGGLLGMNVAGNPWPVTLGQVAFGVAMGMATVLYVFAVKGWLK